jgi:hypothetical protein
MALGPGGPNVVYFATDRLYRSLDKGMNNTVVSQAPIVASIPISAIAVSQLDDNYRIVGLSNGALYYTTTGSSTLTVLDAGNVIPNEYVGRIVFDPTNKTRAYVAVEGYMGDTTSAHSHLWKVSNIAVGPVFVAINGSGATGLPDVPINAGCFAPIHIANGHLPYADSGPVGARGRGGQVAAHDASCMAIRM